MLGRLLDAPCVYVRVRIITYVYYTALTVDYKKTKLLCVTL